jgi:hypothetical protein
MSVWNIGGSTPAPFPGGRIGYQGCMLRIAVPWLLLALGLALAGGGLYAASDGTVEALSIGIIGVAAVIAVSALFYAVGATEDRERHRRG